MKARRLLSSSSSRAFRAAAAAAERSSRAASSLSCSPAAVSSLQKVKQYQRLATSVTYPISVRRRKDPRGMAGRKWSRPESALEARVGLLVVKVVLVKHPNLLLQVLQSRVSRRLRSAAGPGHGALVELLEKVLHLMLV
jgi:hypothetical protein